MTGSQSAPDPACAESTPGGRHWGRTFGRSWGRLAALGVSFGLIAVSVYVLGQILATVDYARLRAALADASARQIALAFAAAGFSYFALTGYDALALRQLRLNVPSSTTALASFTSYAVSFTLGFPLITGATVRYWVYARAGLSAAQVASLTLVAGITFWLGMALVLSAALAFEPWAVGAANHLDWRFNAALGAAGFAAIAAYLAFVASGHRRARFKGVALELPGLWLSLGQIGLGVADLTGAAATLFVLLPNGADVDFQLFLPLYVLAGLLGIASNAPGGIGVFEATMLKLVHGPGQEAMLASLLAFRMVYYVCPFLLALLLLGANEAGWRLGLWRCRTSGGADDAGRSGKSRLDA